MIVEIRQFEFMDCWNVVLLTDLPSQSFVTGNKWVFKLKYRDNVLKSFGGFGLSARKGQRLF